MSYGARPGIGDAVAQITDAFASNGRRSRPRAGYFPKLQRTLQGGKIPRARIGPHHRARPGTALPHNAPTLGAAGGPIGADAEEQRARMWCVINDCWLNQAQ